LGGFYFAHELPLLGLAAVAKAGSHYPPRLILT
jgi:hypothetical protein